MSSSPPSTLGQYQIIREIARSNDIVYEAYDPLMNRRVAIKELQVPPGTTPQQKSDRISRFRREAQAAGTLNHPNIMTVYSFAEDAGRTFMAMEYLDGSTLRNELDTRGFLEVDRAVEVAESVLDGLGHAHSKGVIHRDIKPENIQILSNGQIKITDFGIARLTFQPNLTMDGQVFGTPSYMSPEQIVGKDIDARSDLFSVGVMLYEMLSGTKPFTGDSVVAISYAIMNATPTRPAQVSDSLWRVIQKALDKTPALRYASANEMIDALRQATAPAPAYSPFPGTGAPPLLGTPPPSYNYNPYASPPPPPAPAPSVPPPPFLPGAGTPAGGGYPGAAPSQGGFAYTNAPYSPGAGGPGYAPPAYHGQAAPPSYPYGTPGAQPQPLPVYYPPPPRQPLLKPETKAFLAKLLLTTVVLGTLFVLIALAIQLIVQAASSAAAKRHDESITASQSVGDRRVPVEERIASYEQYRSQLTSEQARLTADRNLAVLYQELGRKYAGVRDPKAEVYYVRATELDPHNPALFTSLGNLYGEQTQFTQDPNLRSQYAEKSARAWHTAWSQETDEQRRLGYGEQAALMYVEYAANLLNQGAGNNREVRNALYAALETASPNGRARGMAQRLLGGEY